MKGAIARASELAAELPMPSFRSSSKILPIRKSTARRPLRKSGMTLKVTLTFLSPVSAPAVRSPALARC